MTDKEKYAQKIPVLAIVGPTACQKTKLSIELAKRLNGEIICADSMQIYKQLNIGTAKPTKEQMQEIKHHLVDFLDITETFSVAQYVTLARECIRQVYLRNKLPIICGGTGLYIKNLLIDNCFIPKNTDHKIKENLEKRAQTQGINALFAELSKIDPQTAAKLHLNDKKRIIRALEIYYTNGKTLTEQNELSQKTCNIYAPCILGVNFKNRASLYDKINKRVDEMMRQGLLQEVKEFVFRQDIKTAKAAIGYKEFIPFLNGDVTLDQAVENLKKDTRRYAKRQITWFKKDKSIFWLFLDEFEDFEETLKKAEHYITAIWKQQTVK